MNHKHQIVLLFFTVFSVLIELPACSAEEPDSTKTKPHSSPKVQVKTTDLPELPLELTSFGGAVANGTLFIYGGHSGTAHSYSTAEQSNEFWSLDLNAPKQWKQLPSGPRLQGLVMLPHKDSVVRIGGFTARNAEGEEHDLHSQQTVSRFDVAKNHWVDLAPLPEPRSSLSAAISGDQIFVIGGWALKGEATEWHGTAWKLNLADPNAVWQPLAKPPFKRRALFATAHDGKIHVIGGMNSNGGPTTRTDVYDPASDSWSQGPNLEGKPLTGFGSAAHSLGGHLYVSTIDGNVQRLNESEKNWEVVSEYDPARFFHVMVPWTDTKMLLVGGANMSVGKFTDLDSVEIATE
jgi:N-acetylneuraminic acid mutarotase